jgi:preprotein translocase subunit SecD
MGLFAGLVFLAGCFSRHPANARPIHLGIFEVVDCKISGTAPMSLKGTTEKYCLAGKPVVDEMDVRAAEATRGESGKTRLSLFFTLKTGQRMRETTERIQAEHLQHNGPGKLGMVIDGTLVSVAELREVLGDALVIDGAFSWEEAVQIAESLRATPKRSSSSN